MRRWCAIVLVGAGLAVVGCGGSDSADQCIILANGGNKLCGDDAKAWCDTTDQFREGDPSLGIQPDSESQRACDSIRGQ